MFDLKTISLIGHLLGVAIGAGAAFMGDLFFFISARDRKFSKDESRFLHIAGNMTWIGLLLLIISGIGLFATNPEQYLNSTKFLAKLVIVAIIIVNGFILHLGHMPRIKKVIGLHFPTSKEFRDNSRIMLMSGAVSVVSWTTVIILGSLKSVPLAVWQILGIYLIFVLVAISIAQMLRKWILGF